MRETLYQTAARHSGETILIGTHATPLRMIETEARGLRVEQAHLVPWAGNASLSAYLVEGETILPLFYSLNSYLGGTATVQRFF